MSKLRLFGIAVYPSLLPERSRGSLIEVVAAGIKKLEPDQEAD